MIEKHFILEEADPVIFYGANNVNIKMLRALCPKLRIMARDNVVRVMGGEEDMADFEDVFQKLEKHCAKFNRLAEEDILNIVKGHTTNAETSQDVIVYSTGGKPITPRSENQRKLVEAYDKWDKIDPYLQPLYDALQEMIPAAKLQEYMDTNVIQIAPLAFMRGRTLNDAVVILDEAQNTTSAQIKMFLTRMGWNTKMIVTGDRTQIDLPLSQKSGLVEAQRILQGVDGIAFVEMTQKDIIRHKLVTRIVEAYKREDDRVKQLREQRENESKIS